MSIDRCGTRVVLALLWIYAFSLLAGDNLLPDGTYFYVIDFFGKYPNVGTYVYINRQEK